MFRYYKRKTTPGYKIEDLREIEDVCTLLGKKQEVFKRPTKCPKEHKIEEYLCMAMAVRKCRTKLPKTLFCLDIKDPNLWIVKCRIGEEKSTCVVLIRKLLAYQSTGEAFQIKSIVALEGVKGYIYIEAYKHPYVKAAVENVDKCA